MRDFTRFRRAKLIKLPSVEERPRVEVPSIGLFAIIFTVIFALHASLLRLPYFWDEAGYFVPAARDLLLTGSPIPSSTLTNAHPPMVMAWLALWWKLSGYTPAVTRTAMLLVAALALLGVYRLARAVANSKVAVATTVLTALYSVFFAQSSLAHLDMAAAALTIWGLLLYVDRRRWGAIILFALAGLAKETAIVTPLALFGWEAIAPWIARTPERRADLCLFPARNWRDTFALFLAVVPLGLWFEYHFARTGFVFGNPEFLRYNVEATASPLRILIALGERLWQAFGYMNMYVLTLSAALALFFPALRRGKGERPRITVPVQAVFGVILAAYVLMLAVVGGAVLARYMLPVIPLVVLVCVSTLWRRVSWWPWIVAVAGIAFVAALFAYPPYRFSPEDNLAYADFVRLHKSAEDFIVRRSPQARVLTAWPASDELTKPYLGYVRHPMQVVRVENFSLPQIEAAAQQPGLYDMALLFSTKAEPLHPLLGRLPFWDRLQEHYFDYHRDLTPQLAANLLNGRIIYEQHRGAEWVAVIEIEGPQDARLYIPF
jgi:hypothetical protein